MELIDIVDSDGNYTGQVVSRSKAHDLDLIHWEVVVFIINDKGEMLLEKRSAKKRFNPNKWAPCAGGVMAGESLEEAVLREIEEELGLKCLVDDLYIFEENLNLTRFYYVICNLSEKEFKIQEEEVSCVKWFDINDVIKMIKDRDDTITLKENRLYLLEELKRL